MSKGIGDVIDAILLLALAACTIASFIRLIVLGDIALGTWGLTVFMLFSLVLYGRTQNE